MQVVARMRAAVDRSLVDGHDVRQRDAEERVVGPGVVPARGREQERPVLTVGAVIVHSPRPGSSVAQTSWCRVGRHPAGVSREKYRIWRPSGIVRTSIRSCRSALQRSVSPGAGGDGTKARVLLAGRIGSLTDGQPGAR
jgi:hypothetical protein